MHRNGHWFNKDADGKPYEVCQLCDLKVPLGAGVKIMEHTLAIAGQCPITDKEEIKLKLGFGM